MQNTPLVVITSGAEHLEKLLKIIFADETSQIPDFHIRL